MAMITRTIVKSTEITFRTVVNGEVSNPKLLEVKGMVSNPVALIKKELKLKKMDSVIIDSMDEDAALYGCTVEEFLSVAHMIEK